MAWTNYHSHSNFCDGKGELEEYIEAAFAKGFPAYGCSSHAPVPFDTSWSMKISDLDIYMGQLDQLKEQWKNKIQIYSGLEVDYIPHKIGPNSSFLKATNLDYTIGSVHFIDTFHDGTPWEIDGLHTLFAKGLKVIFKNDIQSAITRYYELTRMMVENDCPDVVGHLDKIKIQNSNNRYFNESDLWYREEMDKTLKVIAQKGVIVEANTRGLYKNVASLYPSAWVLKKMKTLNIPVTLNADSHHLREIDGEFEQAAQTLLEAGYKKLHVLFNGKWQAFPFSRKGIEIPLNAK